MLVSQQLLPAIGNIFSDVIVFQRHNVLVHHVRQTVPPPNHEMSALVGPIEV